MERLTKRIDGRLVFHNELIGVMMTPSNDAMHQILTRLAAYEDTGLEPEEIERIVDAYGRGHTLRTESAERLEIVREIKTDRLRELMQAEQDERLVVLPCKAGSLIYVGIKPAIITRFFGYVRERYFYAVFCDENKGIDIPFEELGKTVFLTREEAEAALAQNGGQQ